MTFDTTFLSRESFRALRNRFHALAAQRSLTPSEIVLHNLIRQLPADRGFTAVTNKTKLTNGTNPRYSYLTAKGNLQYGGLRNREQFQKTYGFDIPDEEFKRLYGALMNSN